MLDWLSANREWISSGVGVAITAAILPWVWRLVRGQSDGVTPGAHISGSESKEGGAFAIDTGGGGASIKDTTVKEDLFASSSPPDQDQRPKA